MQENHIQFERRKAYTKVLEDNERMYSDELVTKIGQPEFDFLLQEVRMLRKLLAESGILVSSANLEKENLQNFFF